MSESAAARPPLGASQVPAALALAGWLEDGRSGVAAVRSAAGRCRLHLDGGVLRLAADDPLVAAEVERDPEPLIAILAAATAQDLELGLPGEPAPPHPPLPTRVLMEAAVRGRARSQLWSQLGGRGVTLQMAGRSELSRAALEEIEPRLQRLLSRFVKPQRLAEMVGDDEAGLERLGDLARLRAVGLLAPSQTEGEAPGRAVSSRSKELFLRRIAVELERRPLRVNRDEHREQVVEMLRHLGTWSHYELLRVDRHQDEQAVHQAFVEVARLCHPMHASRLGLEGRDAPLDLLFESATEAYLVLSHPDRRRDYDSDLSPEQSGPTREDRRREKAAVARDMYLRARRMALEQDLQPVLELMQQAIQLDPQADYYKLLGDVQRRNPQWKADAVSSYREGVRYRPDDPDLRLHFARALEESGDLEQARIQYLGALELRPGDPAVQQAVDEFEERVSPGKKARPKPDRGEKRRRQSRQSADQDPDDGGIFPTFRRLFGRRR